MVEHEARAQALPEPNSVKIVHGITLTPSKQISQAQKKFSAGDWGSSQSFVCVTYMDKPITVSG
jgi:hypothetical protein